MKPPQKYYPMMVFAVMALVILACSECQGFAPPRSAQSAQRLTSEEVENQGIFGSIENVTQSDPTQVSESYQISASIFVGGKLEPDTKVELKFDANSSAVCASSCVQSISQLGAIAVTFPVTLDDLSADESYVITLSYGNPQTGTPIILATYSGRFRLNAPSLEVLVNGVQQGSANSAGLLLSPGPNSIILRNPSNQTISFQQVLIKNANSNQPALSRFNPAANFGSLAPNSEQVLTLECLPQADVVGLELKYTHLRPQYWYNALRCLAPPPAQVQVSQNGVDIANGGTFTIAPGLYDFEIGLVSGPSVTVRSLSLLPDNGADLLTLNLLGNTTITTQSPSTVFSVTCANRSDLPITRQVAFQYNSTPYRFSLTCQPASTNNQGGFTPLGDPVGDAPEGEDSIIRQPQNPNNPGGGGGFLLGGTCRIIQFQVIFALQSSLPSGTGISTSIDQGGAGDAVSVGVGGAIAGNAFLTNLGNPPQAVTFFVNAGGLGSEALTLTCTP